MADSSPETPAQLGETNSECLATRDLYAAIGDQMAQVIAGQGEILEQLLLTLLCREHALLEGPAGTAKWLAIESLARCCGLTARRIRCSQDLQLDDLLGREPATDPWQASLLLVDNVDYLPGRLRSVVQQAMSERVVETRALRRTIAEPFVVFATRYREDEAPARPTADPHDDRFMLEIEVPYPSYRDEFLLATERSGPPPAPVRQVLDWNQLAAWRSLVLRVAVPPSVVHYAVRLVRATRVHEGENPDFIYEWVLQGAGPRGSHFLVLAAKARATLFGRSQASHEDVRAVCLPVLRHRIHPNQNARANGIRADRVIRRLLEEVPPRVVGDDVPPQEGEALTFHDWVPSGGG